MDATKLFTKIKEIGHANSKREELREFCKLKIDQILKFLPRRVLNSDGADVIDCIFNGLPDLTAPTSRSKVKVIDIVLEAMRKEPTSITHCSDVTTRLCLELPRMPVDDLVRWSNDSVQYIVDDSDINMIWKDVLPECTSAILRYSEVKHCGTDMTTPEFKEQCVRTLCQCRWRERQFVQLAAMFKDMQLTREEHKQVVNKICSYMIDVPPDTLPPLVHQLLKLCKSYNVDIVLGHLSHYFSTRLYSKLEPPPADSESTTMDIDDIVPYDETDINRCLSTCLYHICQGATDPELIRKHIKLWPKSQLLRNPFLLDIALALSEKGTDFRTICLDVIRQAIEQRIMYDQASAESAWVRSVLPPDVDVASVLKVLTNESATHRQTTMGLIHLGLSLVTGRGQSTPARRTIGEIILVRLCRNQQETAQHILALLADRIATESAQEYYANCLYLLCKLSPVSIERGTALSSLVQSISPQGSHHSAAALLTATRPLLHCSNRLRDTVVMMCRKWLYSRDLAPRLTAVSGLTSSLRHLRAGGDAAGDTYSACSYLTQLTVDLHATQMGAPVTSRVRNEAMCMEVVSILRRCLTQDAAVKQLLYTELYESSKEKAVLHESILELLFEHLSKYLPEEDGSRYALVMDKGVLINGVNAVLSEPLGHLLYCISEFLQQSSEDLEDILSSQTDTAAEHLRSKLKLILDQLCENGLGPVDLEHPTITDITPESKAKYLKVQQILHCYEALIAHRITQWTCTSTDEAAKIYDLYKSYNELLEKTKTAPKTGKKALKSTLNETKDSQKSQKEKGKAVKLTSLAKDRAGPFKPLPCLWNLNFCVRVVELLYGDEVPWTSLEQRNQIRSRRDFHQFALKGVLSVVTAEHIDRAKVSKHCVNIARILFDRCLCRFQEMCDFDEQTALSCLDVLRECLSLLFSPNYNFKIQKYLATITNKPEASHLPSVSCILESIHKALLQLKDESGEENEQLYKKPVSSLLHLATVLLELPRDGAACRQYSDILLHLQDYVRTSHIDCVPVLPALLKAARADMIETPFLDDLFVKISSVLGRIDEEDTSAGAESDQFPFIDARSGQVVLGALCGEVAGGLRGVALLLGRARGLRGAGYGLNRVEAELKELNSSLLLSLCQLSSLVRRACAVRVSVGAHSDRVLAGAVRLYATLGAYVRHLTPEEAVDLRLERLLKSSGKKLSSVTDNLITYLEASQTQQTAHRVLRETKQIPRLVLEAENYCRHVIVLSNKAKVNYQQYLSLGTARDFRIKGPLVQEALNTAAPATQDTEIHDAETTILTANSEEENQPDDDEDEDNDGKRNKRRRVS